MPLKDCRRQFTIFFNGFYQAFNKFVEGRFMIFLNGFKVHVYTLCNIFSIMSRLPDSRVPEVCISREADLCPAIR